MVSLVGHDYMNSMRAIGTGNRKGGDNKGKQRMTEVASKSVPKLPRTLSTVRDFGPSSHTPNRMRTTTFQSYQHPLPHSQMVSAHSSDGQNHIPSPVSLFIYLYIHPLYLTIPLS